MSLENRVALVTGAGTGMGRAIALSYAQQGARVFLHYRNSQSSAEAVASQIRAAGGQADLLQADISDEAQIKSLIQKIETASGRLDILVNNAGWTRRVPHSDLDALTDEIWQQTLQTNLMGPFYLIRAALPLLRRSDHPAVINIASTGALTGMASSIAYVASKSALLAITQSLARAFAPQVRFNSIAPGLIRTGFAGWTEENYAPGDDTAPLGRLATVEDVADAALYLASANVTGETIVVDAGFYRLGPRAWGI